MFKIKKLDVKGFSHHLVIVAIVVVVGVGGVYWLIKSHADSCGSSTSASSTTSGSAASGSAASGSCTTTTPAGHGWQLLATGTNNETTESVFACLNVVSPTQWNVRSLATLVPAVKDSRSYTMGISVGTAKNGGVATSRTWWLNEVTEVKVIMNPVLSNNTVTPITQAPTTNPFIKGSGGGAVNVSSLILC